MLLSEVYFILFHVHIQIKFRGRVSNRDILGGFLHISFFVKIKYIGYCGGGICIYLYYLLRLGYGGANTSKLHK